MGDSVVPGVTGLLRDMCASRGIDYELVVELLKIERSHQFQERRHGINDELSQCIQGAASKAEG